MRRISPTAVSIAVACILWAFAANAGNTVGPPAGDRPSKWSAPLGDAGQVPDSREMRALGERIFNKACFYCHGNEGRGDGAGARLLPTRPRDFTLGEYKIRTTPSGSLPVDADIYRTISVGLAEYGMPRFAHLTPRERWAMVYYLKTLSDRFEEEEPEEPVAIEEIPPATQVSIALGREVYRDLKCFDCHGVNGFGDGPSAPTLKDQLGNPAPSLNFHRGERAFKRGAEARDILNTIRTGLDGSPMPSYLESLEEKQAIALTHYIASLAKK